MSELAATHRTDVPVSGLSTPVAHRAGRPLTLSRLAVLTDARAVALLCALSGALAAVTWGTWGDLGADTGYDSLAAGRVAGGELPYVDFVYYYGPLAPALGGLAAWIGGAGLGSSLVLGLLLATAIILATYGLARTQVSASGALLAGAITAGAAFAPNNLSFVLAHSTSAPLAILFTLCFLLALSRYCVTERPLWLATAGTSAGLVALTRPEFLFAVSAAAVVWLATRRVDARRLRRELALFGTPALAIPLVVYGAFAVAISPRRLVLENLFPIDVLRGGPNEVLRIQAPLTAGSFVELLGRLALYALGVAALLLLARALERHGRLRLPAACAVVAGAVCAGAALVVRPETVRYGLEFAYGWIPAGAAIGVAVLLLRWRRSRAWEPQAQILLATTVVLAVLAAKSYGAFFVHAPEPQYAVYAVPFAAVLLARLHLHELAVVRSAALIGSLWLAFLAVTGVVLTLTDARLETATVRGPGGSLSETPGEAVVFAGALERIAAETRAGEAILLAPQLTALYTLADRRNPLPELALQPGALPDAASESRAIARLERAGVRLVVVDRRPFTEFGHGSFGDSFDRRLDAWIRERFERVSTLGADDPGGRQLDIFVRRAS